VAGVNADPDGGRDDDDEDDGLDVSRIDSIGVVLEAGSPLRHCAVGDAAAEAF
jgi:hypothetical protein